MTTEFDAEAGVLRLEHAALSVLSRLAVDPTDPGLTDHATAPPLAELRRAGILGPGGIDPAVRPLAEVLGAPTATLALGYQDPPGGLRRCRGWATSRLLVLAVPADAPTESYDLMADAPAEAGGMVGDLVGLTPGPPASGDAVALAADEVADLLAGRPVPALGTGGGSPPVRWHLEVRGSADGRLEVVDAGDTGLWVAVATEEGGATLTPADPAGVRARIDALVTAALA